MTIRKELELYNQKLMEKPEIVALNKCDSLDDEQIKTKLNELQNVCKSEIFAISAVAKQGLNDCLRALDKHITRSNRSKENENLPQEEHKAWSPLD